LRGGREHGGSLGLGSKPGCHHGRKRARSSPGSLRRAHVASTWGSVARSEDRSIGWPGLGVKGERDPCERDPCQRRTGSGACVAVDARSWRLPAAPWKGPGGEARERPCAGAPRPRLADLCAPLLSWRARRASGARPRALSATRSLARVPGIDCRAVVIVERQQSLGGTQRVATGAQSGRTARTDP
jgi:hypothetical protein